ncbi:MAG TPA: glycosyltransferase family 1 protein [Pyrinomonadaceae bacterium]|jgi:UDP-galactopyranose mutase|nr:glycosyltransferase family 1 protein [Pyrinomonadaceae bacterium]
MQKRTFDLTEPGTGATPDLICFSHLRWDFVYQRPQHLMSRFAKARRVFFVEEPVFDNGSLRLDVSRRENNLYVLRPCLPVGLSSEVAKEAVQREMVDRLIATHGVRDFVAWYYTPMALGFSSHLRPLATVYDCMDELSAFKGASPALRERERELFERADHVFTGGQSLYEAKREQHTSVHAFPSSIDRAHFAQARRGLAEPEDQRDIPHPRLGFFGVIDERFDIELLRAVAAARPDWHFVMIGPVVKIDPATLPQGQNIHYLGGKDYKQLPAYLAGWDVALLLFARNEATRFISPTKTPEYLAAGRPVVSTSIRDVVRPYGQLGLVRIADTPEDFVAAAEAALEEEGRAKWIESVDEFLAQTSWDETWARMCELIDSAVASRRASRAALTKSAAAQSAGFGRLVGATT